MLVDCNELLMAYDFPSMDQSKRPYEAQGKRMREAREACDIEQADLARRVDVEPGTYWRYEAGERSPGRKRMERISAILKRSTAYLYHGEPEVRALSRGEAFARIEDGLDLDEPAKARLRALLNRFNHAITEDYLEAVADLVRQPGVSDATAHSSAVMIATDAIASRTSARKLRKRHSSAPAPQRRKDRHP